LIAAVGGGELRVGLFAPLALLAAALGSGIVARRRT